MTKGPDQHRLVDVEHQAIQDGNVSGTDLILHGVAATPRWFFPDKFAEAASKVVGKKEVEDFLERIQTLVFCKPHTGLGLRYDIYTRRSLIKLYRGRDEQSAIQEILLDYSESLEREATRPSQKSIDLIRKGCIDLLPTFLIDSKHIRMIVTTDVEPVVDDFFHLYLQASQDSLSNHTFLRKMVKAGEDIERLRIETTPYLRNCVEIVRYCTAPWNRGENRHNALANLIDSPAISNEMRAVALIEFATEVTAPRLARKNHSVPEEYFDRADELCKNIENFYLLGLSTRRRARRRISRGRFGEVTNILGLARNYFRQHEANTKYPVEASLLECDRLQCVTYRYKWDKDSLAEAENLAVQSIDKLNQMAHPTLLALFQIQLVQILIIRGELNRARGLLQSALDALEFCPNVVDYANAIVVSVELDMDSTVEYLADNALPDGLYQDYKSRLLEAQSFYEEANHADGLNDYQFVLGSLEIMRHNYNGAIELFSNLIDVFSNADDRMGVRNALFQILTSEILRDGSKARIEELELTCRSEFNDAGLAEDFEEQLNALRELKLN